MHFDESLLLVLNDVSLELHCEVRVVKLASNPLSMDKKTPVVLPQALELNWGYSAGEEATRVFIKLVNYHTYIKVCAAVLLPRKTNQTLISSYSRRYPRSVLVDVPVDFTRQQVRYRLRNSLLLPILGRSREQELPIIPNLDLLARTLSFLCLSDAAALRSTCRQLRDIPVTAGD